jgi:hypothetical protein
MAVGAPDKTPLGQPRIDYNKRFPADYPDPRKAGTPIFAMVDGKEIINTDLNAVIVGGSPYGTWDTKKFPVVAVEGNRQDPFREFTVIFHDELGIKQAFPEFDDPRYEFMLHGGRDGFAINYGAAGAGAEVLANRKAVGPMANCPECKAEEFFLTSWAVGDPAMVVDNPANSGVKATKVLYPDDPSNVSHSYMGDRIKFRNVHAGPKEHHIFHLHAHQWLKSPNADNSTYLDSQGIGPGAGFTYEIAYDGGNRNKTPGDAIFHCHFYPHFAQGMWALWRTHDVFEVGTTWDADGKLAAGTRTLPDAEIAGGTPIPGVVPLPNRPMPPMPGTMGNPGFPFYIAGVAGHRPPKPPKSTAFDGGLPRHVVTSGAATDFFSTKSVDKRTDELKVTYLAETGEPQEIKGMAFHAAGKHNTYKLDLAGNATYLPSGFVTNGLPSKPGAPFADPCRNPDGTAAGNARTYKAAAFQLDVKYNKAGWHFPQHRMFSLWEDVQKTVKGERPPQPMFIRTQTNECIEYRLVNLVPLRYELDDYQVTTPTDVIGQHIHLVKFDVTASDGAANGFNYESGALSPGEVRERIHAIRVGNACAEGAAPTNPDDPKPVCPVARPHPFFGAGTDNQWVGAQEIVERWYADNVLNSQGQDRGLRTIYTHDHFGPSTHQQTGLYAGLVAEPAGSKWWDPDAKQFMGSRPDGGPTNWRADIHTANPAASYREFNIEFSDFVPAYTADAPAKPGAYPQWAVNPAGKKEDGIHNLRKRPDSCPNGDAPPCPEIVASDDPGTMTVNYRNEPLALRLRDPATNKQAAGAAGDLSLAFSSTVQRADARFNTQPTFYPALTAGLDGKDPFTPMLRAYENDKVQVRTLVGGQEEGHNFSMHGLKWLGEPSWTNSGYRASQFMGISEHFEMVLPPLPGNTTANHADYLYKPGSAVDDLWNGLWGILRAYRNNQADLDPLPTGVKTSMNTRYKGQFNGVCPVGKTVPDRLFDVTAVSASTALADGAIVYNRAGGQVQLKDPTGALFVRTTDLDATGKLKAGVRVEPLVLRANAGDCIKLTLRNKLPKAMPDADGWSTLPMIVDNFNANDIRPSSRVGLHAQLVATDVTKDDGVDVGLNKGRAQTVAPDSSITYQWYAGHIEVRNDSLVAIPAEFGAVNLTSSDPIKHSNKGLIGSLIIEPAGTKWQEDGDGDDMRASANIQDAAGKTLFREFVLLFQDDVNMQTGSGTPVPNTAEAEDAEDSGQKGFNYRTEPLWRRLGNKADQPLHDTRLTQFADVLSSAKHGDPQTPIFTVAVGTPVRFRVLQPAGHARNHVFQLHGHGWQENPFDYDLSQNRIKLGDNPLSEWKGSEFGIGPSTQLNLLLTNGAGGAFKVPGDYLFRDMNSFMFDGGLWGIMRVTK